MTDPIFLLDSNICVYVLADAQSVPTRRLSALRPGQAVASSITYAEVAHGVPRDDEKAWRAVEGLFERVPVLPFDKAAARHYREIPFRRGSFDRLIAAHALALDLTLVTDNERHFVDIPGLRVENWMLPL